MLCSATPLSQHDVLQLELMDVSKCCPPVNKTLPCSLWFKSQTDMDAGLIFSQNSHFIWATDELKHPPGVRLNVGQHPITAGRPLKR